ncbi:VanZ family protein [Polaribacter haliotis]|uniref:VanZ family protein n=1 Tax=Polaribacter haliotis TaxID=1888915 RepID=A0A7L8ADN1_9FLAO|nr:VanZ family protein [Polaribacter haliotis]
MLQRIKALLKGKIVIIAVVVTLSILYLSLMKMPKYEVQVSHLDKLQHGFAYFTLSICWLLSFFDKPSKKYLIVFLCILFGIIIEVLQSELTSYRTGDYLDVLANTTGVLIGLVVFNQIYKKNRYN